MWGAVVTTGKRSCLLQVTVLPQNVTVVPQQVTVLPQKTVCIRRRYPFT